MPGEAADRVGAEQLGGAQEGPGGYGRPHPQHVSNAYSHTSSLFQMNS